MMMMQKHWIIGKEDELWVATNLKPWIRWTFDKLDGEFAITRKGTYNQLERKEKKKMYLFVM
jgi:hypothetical protein